MLATNAAAAAARNSHLLFRWVSISRMPVPVPATRSRIHMSTPINSNRSLSSCGARISALSTNGFNLFGRPGLGFRHSSPRSLRVSSGGGSGSGGKAGGGFGGSGNGSSGGGPGGNNWSFLSWYLSLLDSYPVITKAITSAILTLVGDIICQLWIDKAPSMDMKRTFIFTMLGMVLVGPALHFWYLSLSKLVTTPGAYGAFLRLVLDQFLFAPAFIGVFLSALMTLEGNPSNVIPKLKQEWLSSVVANWQLWIPFQFLNFRFVPQQFQVLAANFIALIWNVILSYKAHKEVLPK
ncbi:protein sym-1 isoform X2 [Andrographis paniculata]|uniref:protein sym-1 isoform X1 n=1 Tax=Andrographis paniculata TaxID=175694 RepID=UPI0021E7F74E|nr:protein sym-1 isoform X1 [Andrographis paniculata]XP_051116869.1 protein sym-1 isoform X2 [Andrographis paniculata]